MKKEQIKIILTIIFISSFYIITGLFKDNLFGGILNIISILVICVVFIRFSFDVLLSSNNITKWYFLSGVHLIYIFYPLVLFFQYNHLKDKWIYCISLAISIIILFLIYKKIKNKNIEEKNLKDLKYYNLLLTAIFTTLFPLLSLITDNNDKVEIKLFIACVSPLLFLNIIYEKLLSKK